LSARRAAAVALACAIAFSPACRKRVSPRAEAPRRAAEGPPSLVFLSDFGTADDSVAICKGVMLEIEPSLRIVDLTHAVAPFSIRDGARFLAGAAPHFGPSTVFVGVVDPGVGSTRKAVAARSRRGQVFVVPDNGLLTMVDAADPIVEVREITNPRFVRAAAQSSTFHGRDLFAPAGAHLAHGAAFRDVGPEVKDWVRLDIVPARRTAQGVSGEVVGLDGPYGNLVTNVGADLFAELGHVLGANVEVRLGAERLLVPYVRTFSDVPRGAPLLYVDSRGRVALAVNLGSFAQMHHVEPPVAFEIRNREAR
jgi:S-adenosylmethionine hydrolase